MQKAMILVVDDTAIFRDPLAAALRQAGYETACAGDGEQALAAVAARRPDLIILDMAMPVMDGVGFLRALRARDEARQIPVVVLSAAAEQRVAFEAGMLGADEYFVKSRVSLGEMIERVGQIIARGARPGPSEPPRSPSASPVPQSPVTVGAPPPAPSPKLSPRPSPAAPDPRLVHVMCPRKACGRVMSVAPELRGTSVACTHCGGTLRVPAQRAGASQGARAAGART